jgi:Domain of unknown function (DUF4185)
MTRAEHSPSRRHGTLRRRAFLASAGATLVAAPLAAQTPPRGTQPPQRPALTPSRAALGFIPGSTVKLEQLIGDYDKERRVATANRTESRYGIIGTDLGYSFEHDGLLYFLFGDTLGRGGGDAIASSRTQRPEDGLKLDFLTDARRAYLKIAPTGIDMGGFNVPTAGISLGGRAYVAVKTGHSPDRRPTDYSVLTRFDPAIGSFTPLRTLSRLPDGKVIKLAMRRAPEPITGLPPGGPFVLVWSTGVHRASDAYLSVIPEASFESGAGTRFFAGLDSNRQPVWSEREAQARAIVEHPVMGDISVIWAAAVRRWIMLYDSRNPLAIVLRSAPSPWGPWSAPQSILRGGADLPAFVHRPGRADGVAGPVIVEGRPDPETVAGGAYAPYAIERFAKLEGDTLSIYYLLSTWNPYVVVLMRSQLRFDPAAME